MRISPGARLGALEIVDQRHAVDLRRLRGHARLPEQIRLLRNSFHQHRNFAADQLPVAPRAKSSAGSPSAGACGCRWCAHPLCRPAEAARWCPRRNRRKRPGGRTARPRTNRHSSSKSASVSPGNPTIKLVRIATPGMVAADPLDQLQEDIAGRAALHALQHRRAGVLQRHVDVLHQRRMRGDGIEQFLRDLVRIGVKEADPLFVRVSRFAPAAPAAAPGRPSIPRSSP